MWTKYGSGSEACERRTAGNIGTPIDWFSCHSPFSKGSKYPRNRIDRIAFICEISFSKFPEK
jgi:hypothetical protein